MEAAVAVVVPLVALAVVEVQVGVLGVACLALVLAPIPTTPCRPPRIRRFVSCVSTTYWDFLFIHTKGHQVSSEQ